VGSGSPLHENLTWSKRLSFLLKAKANVNPLQPWHDTELKAGASYRFLASDYIKKNLWKLSPPSVSAGLGHFTGLRTDCFGFMLTLSV
jgi:hypothetical protein